MNEKSKKIIQQLVEDRELLRQKMLWEADSSAMATLSAFLYIAAGRRADIERYTECKKHFKRTVNVFSEMRGVSEAIVITKMSLAADYESYLAGVTEVYKKLRSIHKLTASPYMVLAAVNIYEAGGTERADAQIEKLEKIYKEMKADHFWLTGDEDRPFLAMLVSRDIDIAPISGEIAACYEASKKLSFSKEAMHTASQIMSLAAGSPEEKAAKLSKTITALRGYKVRGMKYELMPIAAALGFIEESPENIAAGIKEIYDDLATQKGFKWYLANTKRAMYASLIYALASIDADKALISSVVNTSITNIIIDEIVDMIIVMSATSAAVNSSASSSH